MQTRLQQCAVVQGGRLTRSSSKHSTLLATPAVTGSTSGPVVLRKCFVNDRHECAQVNPGAWAAIVCVWVGGGGLVGACENPLTVAGACF